MMRHTKNGSERSFRSYHCRRSNLERPQLILAGSGRLLEYCSTMLMRDHLPLLKLLVVVD